MADKLGMTVIPGEDWRAWSVDEVPAGYVTVYDNPTGPSNFTFITCAPSQALAITAALATPESVCPLAMPSSLRRTRRADFAVLVAPQTPAAPAAASKKPGTWCRSISPPVHSSCSGASSTVARSSGPARAAVFSASVLHYVCASTGQNQWPGLSESKMVCRVLFRSSWHSSSSSCPAAQRARPSWRRPRSPAP